jgi:dihydroorotate dehydrogenase
VIYEALRPLLFALEPERVHRAAVRAGHRLGEWRWARSLLGALCRTDDPRLRVRTMGLDFPSPLGVAAGFDKNAMLVPILEALGFGFVEVGTVTPRPWGGNPQPRVFRLPADRALVNRMGLPNGGAASVAWRLGHAGGVSLPVGVNVGRVGDRADADPVDDFLEAIRLVRGAAGYIALNVSCPNTEDGRAFESDMASYERLLAAVAEELGGAVPWLVKLSPDTSWPHMREMVDVALARGASGLILGNTTRAREDLATPMDEVRSLGPGGLSGHPLRRRANLMMRELRHHVGEGPCLIGVGGIFDAVDVRERLDAGATLVQMYTGLVYGGPFVARNIHRALVARG